MHERRQGEGRKRRWHMWPVPAPGTGATSATGVSTFSGSPLTEAAVTDSLASPPSSFLKDGRKISIGDCALFQDGDCPPFIGIVRWFSVSKEESIKLGVNRLYRPSDIKLSTGNLLEAAPNEVFYSFQKDEISADLLLHPCKVAFLRKGVELPSGISSFVCRRAYDIANECLWWLTDQGYIHEQREEIAQLLGKTQTEMHAAVQSGGRSPKQSNGPSSTQLLKSTSDSVQSSSTSYPSQAKGRKRGDKGDLGSDSVKRERSVKVDNIDSSNCKVESMIKTEIAKITDKGGLINNDAVEKLVQLMQLDKGERKIDLAGRILLADVIAATDRNDCLGRFVQLRGVPFLDDWLQEAHKGKNGDGTSPKEGDKSLEDLLLALLRALDKLPVNLDALQACNIGKSVNHLRSHRNLEIQKKARSLVDTWKKRVDEEMTKQEMTKLSETKSACPNQSASWPGKSGFSEVSHGGNRRSGSNEAAAKSSNAQTSSCKSLQTKIGHGDSNVKMSPGQSGSPKLPSVLSTSGPVGMKDSQLKAGGSTWTGEPPAVKEEKSSSSSQSQNNSQSCSSDHTKSMSSTWKEDNRSSAGGSLNSSKALGGTSRNRKSSNNVAGTCVSGIQKDSGSGKSSRSMRNAAQEKIPHAGLTSEKIVDVPTADHGSNHRLIVRLPNPGRSPARSTSGGSFEDPSLTGSRASSPGVPEKIEHTDRRAKLSGDACQASTAADVNADSWQSNDLKGGVGSDDGDRPTTAVLDEERSSTDDTVKAAAMPRDANSSEPKPGKSFEASLSSINALIESCVKYSEASASSGGDHSGMNLLASVAAGEISKSNVVSPTESPRGKSPAAEDPHTVNEVQSTLLSDNIPPAVKAESDHDKHGSASSLQVQDEIKQQCAGSISNSCGGKSIVSPQEARSLSAYKEHTVSTAVSCKDNELIVKSEGKPNAVTADGCMPVLTSLAYVESPSDEDSSRRLRKKRKACGPVPEGSSDSKRKVKNPSERSSPFGDETGLPPAASSAKHEKNLDDVKHEKDSVERVSSCPPEKQGLVDGVSHDVATSDQQVDAATSVCQDYACGNKDKAITSSPTVVNSNDDAEPKEEEANSMGEKIQLEASDNEKNVHTSIAAPALDGRIGSSLLPSGHDVAVNMEMEVSRDNLTLAGGNAETSIVLEDEVVHSGKPTCSQLPRAEEVVGKVSSSVEASLVVIAPVADTSRNCDFDLNEGFCVDEGNILEPVASSGLGSSSSHLLPFTVSTMSSVSSVPITVASPAKGPFLSPETFLKGKGEPGWKGSAATSAFRPAEPRKVQELPLCLSDAPSSEAASSKHCRPVLDIDLNVADERVAEDIAMQSASQERHSGSGAIINCDPPIRSSMGLDLDLNRVDDSTENGQVPVNVSRRLEAPLVPVRSASGSGGANVLRDFDLNNGPSLDEVSSEPVTQSQQTKASNVPFLPSLRTNNSELGNLSTWFPPGNSYPAVAIPSFLPDRGDQPYPIVAGPNAQRIIGSANGSSAFGNDLYRGSILSSSPAVAFTPAAPFPYAGFPFGTSFPLSSTSFPGVSTAYADSATGGGPCFPAIATPLMGSAGASSSPYVRPYVIGLHEGSTSSGADSSSQKWGQQNLDLNAGPCGADIEGRVERSSMASRQLSEEQARMFQAAANRGLKRREPEGGWDAERFTYK